MVAKKEPARVVASIVADLEAKGVDTVLVGGMALIVLGSKRVTWDFDLLVSNAAPALHDLIGIMYRHGLELVTKFSPAGDVKRTIDTVRIAALKLLSDLPNSLFFYDWKTELRIDLLLDFPVAARGIIERATRLKVTGGSLRVASPEDLLKLKEIAYADRKLSTDAQDLEFLRKVIGAARSAKRRFLP